MSILLAVLRLALSLSHAEKVHAGDAITVTGSAAFARGARYSFFIGEEYAAWTRLDDDTAVIVVPPVSAGQQRIAAARTLTTNVSEARGIGAVTVEESRSVVVARAVATAPGRIDLGSFATITADAACTIAQLRSDEENAFVRSELANAALPPQSLGDVIVISAGARVSIDTIRVRVPDTWRGHEPELYAGSVDRGAHDEEIAGLVSLHASWNPAARLLTASIDPPLRIGKGEQQTIYVAVKQQTPH